MATNKLNIATIATQGVYIPPNVELPFNPELRCEFRHVEDDDVLGLFPGIQCRNRAANCHSCGRNSGLCRKHMDVLEETGNKVCMECAMEADRIALLRASGQLVV